ncbi:MAG: heavy metal translocating P-type ATPase [Rhodocyclaceae bacterium]|nr:heavy metal translocating P-type ATPase [Rhodocyclaceae bacterium]
MSVSCYHCGLPIPPAADFSVRINDTPQAMCCAGCQAVAQAIVDNGLTRYYAHRDALPESPREAVPAALQELGLFDHPSLQKNFVHRVDDDENQCEANLLLEGITCAACVWLNEAQLRQQSGVTAVSVNYSTRRARVQWDARLTKLSNILAAVAAIGYRAHPYDIARAEALARAERKRALWGLFVAGFGMMQVMMYAVPVYLADVGVGGDMSVGVEQLMRWASLILTLPVVLYSAAPFFISARRDLMRRRMGMDVPVALGVGAAFLASVWATLSGSGAVYFDSVTMFVFFLLSGRFLEMLARQKSARSVEVMARAVPSFAERMNGSNFERVAVADLCIGDLVRVAPGDTVPADGVVIDGQSSADESLLTGESIPVKKNCADLLVGGSINIDSPLVMRVEQLGEGTRLAAITRLMERAATEKPKVVLLADRIAGRFVVALLLLAIASGVFWWWLEPARALWIFVAVLVVSCPCALSLATPAALTVATGAMAARGVLVTRGHAIEALARATHFVFDKTGTLTEGRMAIVEVVSYVGNATQARKIAAALERGSKHPIAQALHADDDLSLILTNAKSISGEGVAGEIDGVMWRLGRAEFVGALHGIAIPAQSISPVGASDTLLYLGNASGYVAAIALRDTVRTDAAQTIAALKAMGLSLSIFSGDLPTVAARVGEQLGIQDARGNMLPQDKLAAVRALQAKGAIVCMVGDGVNDAPVLAQAQVSMAMSGGADLARLNSDIVLLGSRLEAVTDALLLARHTMRIVRQNLAWSFAYNFLAIPLAVVGWVTPWMAGIGMSSSSLLVVLNALRLQGDKR